MPVPPIAPKPSSLPVAPGSGQEQGAHLRADIEARYAETKTRRLRLKLLRIASETSPRLTGGVRVEDVVARARVMELYVLGLPSGSDASDSAGPGAALPEASSDPAGPERGAPG